MKKYLSLLALISVSVLASCRNVPPAAYATRGNPESLLDYSSQRVSFNVNNQSGVDDMTAWINKDRPTRAELACANGGGEASCSRAQEALNSFGVPYKDAMSKDGSDKAVLIYERTMARDCDNRYVDNHQNSLNLNHPTFGCSIAVNTVQMVTNKSEFKNPALRDLPDASHAEGDYRSYIKSR